MPTEPSLTSAVRGSERLGKIIRRKLIPSLEHVTWRGSYGRSKSISNLVAADPFCHKLLNFLDACGVNLTRLPLTAFVIVMAAPSVSMRGPAVLATCAQENCVSNNTEKKEVVSDKYHKVRFYFPHV